MHPVRPVTLHFGGPNLDFSQFGGFGPGFWPVWEVRTRILAHLGGPSLDFGPFGRSGPGFGPNLEGLTHMRGVRPGFGPILGGQTWIFGGSRPGFGSILGSPPGFWTIWEGPELDLGPFWGSGLDLGLF